MIRLNKDHLDKLGIVTLQDFINLCQKSEHREDDEYYEESFEQMYGIFKQCLAEELPMFTQEEILKISKNYHKLRDFFGDWTYIEILLDTLDFELHIKGTTNV